MGWYNSLGEISRAWVMACIVLIVLAVLVMGSLVIERLASFDHIHPAHTHPHEHEAHEHPHPWPEHRHDVEGRTN